jgi:hypothetical protein
VDEVVIALPMKSLYQEASKIFAACEEQGIIVRNLSDIFTAVFPVLEPNISKASR